MCHYDTLPCLRQPAPHNRPMKDKRRDGEDYLKEFPALARWINQCVICQQRGHHPDLPTALTRRSSAGEFTTAGARNLRSMFPNPLKLDQLGRCDVCASVATPEAL